MKKSELIFVSGMVILIALVAYVAFATDLPRHWLDNYAMRRLNDWTDPLARDEDPLRAKVHEKIRTHTRIQAQITDGEFRGEWLGVEMLQYPTDLMSYQLLLWDIRPDLIIETGTFRGSTSLYLSMLCDHIQPEAEIITVDIDPSGWNETLEKIAKEPLVNRLKDRITFLEGSSTSDEVIEAIRKRFEGKHSVLVILDSLHTPEHVYDELKRYSDFVTEGSYLIVNDTHFDAWLRTPGPLEAVNRFLAEDSRFEKDPSRNQFLITCMPEGFLKRLPAKNATPTPGG